MTDKPCKQNKLRGWIKASLRFLDKARNLYVGCMYNCADWVGPGDDMGVPPAYFPALPTRSFPSKNANDLRDLIRANSKSNTINRVGSKIEICSKSELVKKLELEILQLRQQRESHAMAKKVQRMKCCELIETIDEDKPCEFSDHVKVRTDFLQEPRSSSCAATKRIRAVY